MGGALLTAVRVFWKSGGPRNRHRHWRQNSQAWPEEQKALRQDREGSWDQECRLRRLAGGGQELRRAPLMLALTITSCMTLGT